VLRGAGARRPREARAGAPQARAAAAPDAFDEALLAKVHAPRYLDFIAHAWDEWVALDPANATRDALPSYWPTRTMRTDVLPSQFSGAHGPVLFRCRHAAHRRHLGAARHGAACAWTAARRVHRRRAGGLRAHAAAGHHAGPTSSAATASSTTRRSRRRRCATRASNAWPCSTSTTTTATARRPSSTSASDVHFASLHGDPLTDYPYYLGHADERGAGKGEGFNHNLPLPRGTGFAAWRAALADRAGTASPR
jgi:acetoin utilization deacetylase AcuC-like enzyme